MTQRGARTSGCHLSTLSLQEYDYDVWQSTAHEQGKIRRVAINTGGGDAPGLNAVIRAATLAAINRGWEVVGIRDGYNGLFLPEQYPDGGLINLTRSRVRGITHMGGTILGTTNSGNPLHYPMVDKRGRAYEKDRSDEIMRAFRKEKIDALICHWRRWIVVDRECVCGKGAARDRRAQDDR